MNTKISPDFERLSAYLDNQLSPAEKADLEARLATETELQATLNDLRRTVRALRSLPTVKPPRSLTLTPEQVGARARRGPLFPVFRLGAAFCALLLAFAVARDFATSGLATSATRDTTAQSGVVTPLSLPNAAAVFTPTPEARVDAYGSGAPAPTTGASAATGATPFAHLAPAVTSETPTVGDQQFSATADATNKSTAPTETPAATAVSVAALPPSATASTPVNAVPQPSAQAPSDLRLVETVLAALALVLAAAAWLTRRN